MFASDTKLPVTGGPEKRDYVRSMFTAIAPTYDRLNRIISLTLDQRWRRLAIRQLDWQRAPAGCYLDLCAGTMDFAALLAAEPGFSGRIAATDFALPMLRLGTHKTDRAAAVAADALALPYRNATFDGATVGWGLRNLTDLAAGLAEAARVLKPGARLVVLETSQPAHQPMRMLHALYAGHVLPKVGRLVSKHTTAYSWLPESARYFPGPEQLATIMTEAGFGSVRFQLLTGGVTAMHVGTRV